ncbi:phosphosulfolactate synthase [soil metagenome]
MNPAFSFIGVPKQTAKPRASGLTMMIDFGVPLNAQRDVLAVGADFIDLAKVAVGISGIIDEDVLVEKLSAYRDAGVEPFPGGMFAEMAYSQGQIGEYYEECARVGYRLIEISDNVIHFTPVERTDLIRRAVEDHGFKVLGEVGSKHAKTDAATLVTDATESLSAGAWKVFIEAAEFVSENGFDQMLATKLLEEVGGHNILFELPGKWIANVHLHEIHQMMVWLISEIGADVNIANVAPEDVIALQTLRAGVGVNMAWE